MSMNMNAGSPGLNLIITQEEPTGPGWNLTDDRPEVTFKTVLGDRRSEHVYANGIEVGVIQQTATGFRIPNTREAAETKEPLVEYLLRTFLDQHGAMPRICVERNVPLLFHQAATQIFGHVRNALDFGVLDRREFHGLLFNLQMLSMNARPDALRWFEGELGGLLAVSASRLDEPQEIEFNPKRAEVGA